MKNKKQNKIELCQGTESVLIGLYCVSSGDGTATVVYGSSGTRFVLEDDALSSGGRRRRRGGGTFSARDLSLSF